MVSSIADLKRAGAEESVSRERYQVSLPDWTGPFDLLLQVIEEKSLSLLDLDISKLLEGYMERLQDTSLIDVDEAGEFLVVGASLAQIKSKLLLPKEEEPQEEEKDPREELVRYLLEYQKIKQAATMLGERPVLGRDVFTKGVHEYFEGIEGEGRGNLFQLVKGFQKVLREIKSSTPMHFVREEVSVAQRLQDIFTTVTERKEVEFRELVKAAQSKTFVVVSFLALLELVRLKKIKLIVSDETGSKIWLRSVEGADPNDLLKSEFDENSIPLEGAEENVITQVQN